MAAQAAARASAPPPGGVGGPHRSTSRQPYLSSVGTRSTDGGCRIVISPNGPKGGAVNPEHAQPEHAPPGDVLYRALFELSPDGVVVLDVSTLLPIVFNDQAHLQLGYSREEFAALRIQDHEAYKDHGDTALRIGRLGDSECDTFTTQHRKKSGGRRDVVVTVKRLSVAGRDVFHVITRDVTGSRRAEEAAKQAEAQVEQARLMEAVGRLAGEMARDFNHSLTTILGVCNLALSTEDIGPLARRDVDEIKRVAHKATTLTSRLLSFARQNGGAPVRLDLNDVVRDLGRLLGPAMGPGVCLNVDPCDAKLPLDVDPGELDDALTSLVTNAREALTAEGAIDLATSEQTVDAGSALCAKGIPPGRYAVVEVRDGGVGMDEETARRVYEPFFTTKPTGTGAGLGLSIVHGVVQRAGGHIRADTASGLGTTVTLYLPLAVGGVATDSLERPVADGARGAETVLVVEDEPGVRKLVERILGQRGYSVLAAGSAREAVRIAQDHPHPLDLVVTDVVMPDRNGPELVAALRRDYPGLRALFMSGYARTALARAATFAVGRSHPPGEEGAGPATDVAEDTGHLAAGPLELPPLDDFLEKPFTPDSLASAVRRVLDGMDGPPNSHRDGGGRGRGERRDQGSGESQSTGPDSKSVTRRRSTMLHARSK